MKSRPIPIGVVDTGLAGGIHNAAVDRACLALRAQGHGSVLLDADIATMLKTEALIRPPGGTLRARAYFTPQDACLHGIEFAAEAKLDAGLLTQIMNFVPRQPVSPCEKTNHETSRLP